MIQFQEILKKHTRECVQTMTQIGLDAYRLHNNSLSPADLIKLKDRVIDAVAPIYNEFVLELIITGYHASGSCKEGFCAKCLPAQKLVPFKELPQGAQEHFMAIFIGFAKQLLKS